MTGAPPHFSRNVREFLDNQYPQRWIGRGGSHHWPARSPDLNLNHLKSIIYRLPINSEADLRVRIQEAFVSVTEEMITKATNGLLLKFSLRVGYGSFFVFRCTLDTDKFDISKLPSDYK
jgi:hypothetical protein